MPLSASYAIGEAAGVERSVSRSFRDAPLFLGLFTAQIVLGATVAMTPVDVIQLLIGTQVLQGLISPVVLVYLLVLTNRRSVLGQAANDLFVVRVAGNVPGAECLGSLDYALAALGESVKLVVVLGHENCGAIELGVDAARETIGGVATPGGSMSYLVGQLYRSSAQALREDPANPFEAAMRLQVVHTVAELRAAKDLSAAYIVGARYDLGSGLVRLVD